MQKKTIILYNLWQHTYQQHSTYVKFIKMSKLMSYLITLTKDTLHHDAGNDGDFVQGGTRTSCRQKLISMETNTQKKLANQREITAKWLIAEELVGQTYWQFCKTVSRSVVTGRSAGCWYWSKRYQTPIQARPSNQTSSQLFISWQCSNSVGRSYFNLK